MDEEIIYKYLEELLSTLDITLEQSDSYSGEGGLINLKGKKRLIISAYMPIPDRNTAICRVLSKMDLEGVSMVPVIRERISGDEWE
ncbi:MAG: hypothetical protein ACLFQK_09005 [Fibrobacterota bacterium]